MIFLKWTGYRIICGHIRRTYAFNIGTKGESPQSSEGAIPLPDIKETMKKKEEEERARIEEEKLKQKRRIKRSDKEAFIRVSLML